MNEILFLDTNAIMDLAYSGKDIDHFVLSSITLMELEHIKTGNKDQITKYKARKAIRFLDGHPEKYEVVVYNDEIAEVIKSLHLSEESPDNKICGCCKYYTDKSDKKVLFLSNDICCRSIAGIIFDLNISRLAFSEEIYQGYKVIEGTTEEINLAMEHLDYSEWHTNEYLVIKNKDDSTEKEMRFDGQSFVSLKLPHSKFIKGKNSLQRCALDMLMNPDITTVGVLGGYGSGKSFLSMQMALYNVREKGRQATILGVRSPVGEGREVGFLPGGLDEKTAGFFVPLTQQLNGGEFEVEQLKQRGILEQNIPYYMKGTTYNNTIMLVDEAEDLDEKQIRLVGTRVGENSRIFFAGDYKQSVIDTSEHNALVKMCNELKGDPKFGCIYLGEDVRSSTSKMFANLFQ